jgi:hemolysin III
VTAIVAAPLLFPLTESLPALAVNTIGSVAFAATLVLLYLCSTLYHLLPEGRARLIMLRLDQGAIYLFIAGSFTPFALVSPDAAGTWTLLALVWLLAAAGFTLKVCGRLSHPHVSTGLYLFMGWVVLTFAIPLIEQLHRPTMLWLIAGGIAYSIGVIFFVLDGRMRYAHAVWHGFVAVGSCCHFVAVLRVTH